MSRPILIFFTFLIIALIVQGTLWKYVFLSDYRGWMERIEALYQGNFALFEIPSFANPDAAMLTVATIARFIGVPLLPSLQGSTALLNAVATAGVVATAFALRPQSQWWLGAGSMLLFHDAYLESTPHDAIIAPTITLIFLLCLYRYERPTKTVGPLLFMGVASGSALATFLPLALLFLIPIVLFLLVSRHLNRKQLGLFLVITLAAVLLFDPFLLIMPLDHLRAIYGQTVRHGLEFTQPPLPLSGFFNVAPLTILSLGLAIAYGVFYKRLPYTLPRPFLIFLIVTTAFVCYVLFSAEYQTYRAFHSIFFLWDSLLPLFLLTLLNRTTALFPQGIRRGVTLIIIIIPLIRFVTAYILHPPGSIGI